VRLKNTNAKDSNLGWDCAKYQLQLAISSVATRTDVSNGRGGFWSETKDTLTMHMISIFE